MKKYDKPIQGTISYKIGAMSQFANAWIGSGNRDQTFSARTWEGRIKGIVWCKCASIFIDQLFFWTKDHTKTSFYSDDEITYHNLVQTKYFTDEESIDD